MPMLSGPLEIQAATLQPLPRWWSLSLPRRQLLLIGAYLHVQFASLAPKNAAVLAYLVFMAINILGVEIAASFEFIVSLPLMKRTNWVKGVLDVDH